MKRKEGLHHSCKRRGRRGFRVGPGVGGRRFLWKGYKQFFAATREGMRERAGGRKPFSRYLSHFHLFPPSLFSRCQVINRLFGSAHEMPNMQVYISKTTCKYVRKFRITLIKLITGNLPRPLQCFRNNKKTSLVYVSLLILL